MSFACGGSITNLSLVGHILQTTISFKTEVMGEKKEGGTVTDERGLESHISHVQSMGLVSILI